MGLISLSGPTPGGFTVGHNVELFGHFPNMCKKRFFHILQIMNNSIKFLDIHVTSRISEGKRKRPESIILSFVDFRDCHLLHMFRLRPCFDHTLLKKHNIFFLISLYPRSDRLFQNRKSMAKLMEWVSYLYLVALRFTVGHNVELFGHFLNMCKKRFFHILSNYEQYHQVS